MKLAKTQTELDPTQNLNTLRKEKRLTTSEERDQVANTVAVIKKSLSY